MTPASSPALSLHLEDEAATLRLGGRLAGALSPGMYIALSGDLGTGKTTLVRGMLAGLGHEGPVRSPTYTLLEPYLFSKLDFYHFDLFRFKDELEWHDSGFRDYFNADSVCVVEWPEKAAYLLPRPDLEIQIAVYQRGRDLLINALTETGRRCIEQLQDKATTPRR
jgi:tRNA threonylcarbamoyladenosine biosynthesis protein TsaE